MKKYNPSCDAYKRSLTSGFGSTSSTNLIDDLYNSLFGNTVSSCITPVKSEIIPIPAPTRAVFNGPATILFWPDGTKTVVKCQPDDIYDPEKGVALAILKKIFGGSRYNDVLRRLVENAGKPSC